MILRTPIKVGTMTLKNRLVMPPMASAKSSSEGRVTEELIAYYDEKTKDGAVGLVILEHSYVMQEGKASRGQLSFTEDADMEGLGRLVRVIHRNGSPVFAQLNHAGGATNSQVTGGPIFSSSQVTLAKAKGEQACEMDREHISEVICAFAKAALRAKKAGVDGVEIHSAHGYLLNQFYSPLVNKRTDIYTGANLEGRLRLHLEIVRAVRESIGDDMPIALRLRACDYADGGSTIADSVEAAKILEKGGVDLLDISGGFCGYVNPNSQEEGYFREITREIRKQVSIPVILTGGIVTPEGAERLLQSKEADLIGVGRMILKDSGWAKNAMSGKS